MMNCTGKNCIMQYNKVDPATCKCVNYCPQAIPPKTNFDKFKAMDKRELAEYLFERGNYQEYCYGIYAYQDDCEEPQEENFCIEQIIKWLNQEAK